MRLIVGLGNPGPRYAGTRHNVGVLAIERAAAQWSVRLRVERLIRHGHGTVAGKEVVLAQPLTYMNENGPVVRQLLLALTASPAELLVIHDDLDLPLGRLRLKRTGGAGGHNGIRSLHVALQTPDFHRLKIGIGRPPAEQDSADYVLSPFRPEEWPVVDAAITRSVEALGCMIEQGVEVAMNRFNVRESEEQ